VTPTYRVGSRGSALALAQTRLIIDGLRARRPGAAFEIVEIVTHGDRFQATPIAEMGARLETGIFNTALEQAVLRGEVDFATCSFKDVESQLPAGLAAVPVGAREDFRDVLVSRHGTGLAGLPPGALLATSSPRRTSQLLRLRPDLRFHPLRGNITTRVERDVARFDGIVIAAAGLLRLGLERHVTDWFGPERLLPAAAQGALGCEYRADREDVRRLIAELRDDATERCVLAEKALLVRLSGGCYAPIGMLAEQTGSRLRLRCRIVSQDGRRMAEADAEGPVSTWKQGLESLAAELERQGARALVAETREAMLAGAAERSEP
jgi:hydroxymethylbilane synthase